jgi:hypothetical protein
MSASLPRFHSVLHQCRDILRKEGITGMDSMKHMTLYVLARALTKEECHRLSISERFAWEHFLDLAMKDRRQECYDLMYTLTGNDLISHLDTIFGTRNFNFKLRSIDNHVALLKLLNPVNLKELEGSVDILGTVYENHLGSGSNKSAMRDLGQFFTDRRVCSYMAKLCDPQVYSDGTAESLLDPTMGTGGFLTAYVDFLKEKGAHINWNTMQMDVAGYDIDEFVMSIGRINMYLSTGVVFERITHRDTLTHDVGEQHQRLKFKVILANMPFGVKGLKFTDCCPRVKGLHCDGTKSEPLFLNLMMAALDEGGRCAVVVPDGVLTNNSKQHNATRKYLLDNFELKRVIKMKGQFFSNTGIQPSILFFEKSGLPTECVDFWEVEQTNAGPVTERFLLSVPRTDLDESCLLDARRYQTQTAETISEFPLVTLGDLLTDHIVRRPVSAKDADGSGFPLYSSSTDYAYHSVAEFQQGHYILQGSRGTIAKAIHYQTHPFSVSNNVLVLSNKAPDRVSLKYVYYYLKTTRIADSVATTSVIPMLTKQMFEAIQIPLPPLSLQTEIVSALDAVYGVSTAVSQALQMNTKQSILQAKSLKHREYPSFRLGDLLTSVKAPTITLANATPGPFPLYSASVDVKSHTTSVLDGTPSIVQACVGSIEHGIHYVEQPFAITGNLWVLRLKEQTAVTHLKYIYHYLKESKCVTEKINHSVIPKVSKSDFDEICIPVPPLEDQKKLLCGFDALEKERSVFQTILDQTEERAKALLELYLLR